MSAQPKWSSSRPAANQFPRHGCMNELKIRQQFDSQATIGHWCGWLILLTFYPWVFVQPGTGRRMVNDAGIKCLHWNSKVFCQSIIDPDGLSLSTLFQKFHTYIWNVLKDSGQVLFCLTFPLEICLFQKYSCQKTSKMSGQFYMFYSLGKVNQG